MTEQIVLPDVVSTGPYQVAFNGEPRSVTFFDPGGNEIGSSEIPGGCFGTAAVTLFGTTDKYVDYLANVASIDKLSSDSLQAWYSSDEYSAASDEWSKCMAAQGYSYDDPNDPLGGDWPGEAASETEIHTAVADVDCKDKVRFVERAVAFEDDYQERQMGLYAVVIREVEQSTATVLDQD